MPWSTNSDLPDSVRQVLPAAAQSLYRRAFNAALQEYGDEESASRVAWAAVERLYEKSGDQWVRREGNQAQSFVVGSLLVVEADEGDPDLQTIPYAKGELLKFSGVLARAEVNKNRDEVDDEGIRQICATLPLMPVDDEHAREKVVGVFVEASPVSFTSAEVDNGAVNVTGIVYARRFPEVAAAVLAGEKGLSIEARAARAVCSLCGREFDREDDYCTCLKNRLYGSGAVRRLYDLQAEGGALTRTPAGTGTAIDPQSIVMLASELTYDDQLLPHTAPMLGEERIRARDDVSEADKRRAEKEYGDVEYADSKNSKYPLDTYKHVRAAISYFSMPRNYEKYSESEREAIWERIKRAAKKFDIKIEGSTSRVAFTVDPGEPLDQRYKGFLDSALEIIGSYYQDFPSHLEAVLPPDLATMKELGAEDAYAMALPSEGKIVFSPEHQQDMALFDGALTPENIREVRAAKSIFHEILHFGPGQAEDYWGGQVEGRLGEPLRELAAAWHLFHNVLYESTPDALVAGIKAQLSYANRFPWIVQIAVLVAGAGATDWVRDSLVATDDRPLQQVLTALGRFGLDQREAAQYILSPPGVERPGRVDRLVVEATVSVTGDDPLRWYLNQPMKEAIMPNMQAGVPSGVALYAPGKGTEWSLWGPKSEWSLWAVPPSEGEPMEPMGDEHPCPVCGGMGKVKPTEWSLWDSQGADETEWSPLDTSKGGLFVPNNRKTEWSLWDGAALPAPPDSNPQIATLQSQLQEALAKVEAAQTAVETAQAEVETKVQAAEARLAEAQSKLEASEVRNATLVTASRLRELSELMGPEKAEARRDQVAILSEENWTLMVASIRDVAQPRSLKGTFTPHGDNPQPPAEIKTFAGIFG